jgi:hypothetical protein
MSSNRRLSQLAAETLVRTTPLSERIKIAQTYNLPQSTRNTLLRPSSAALKIQRAFRQFSKENPIERRGQTKILKTANRQRSVNATKWRLLAGLDRNNRRQLLNKSNAEIREFFSKKYNRTRNPFRAANQSSSTARMHAKSNSAFRKYVTQRYPTYRRAAEDFGFINRIIKRGGNATLLYPRLKKEWW